MLIHGFNKKVANATNENEMAQSLQSKCTLYMHAVAQSNRLKITLKNKSSYDNIYLTFSVKHQISKL